MPSSLQYALKHRVIIACMLMPLVFAIDFRRSFRWRGTMISVKFGSLHGISDTPVIKFVRQQTGADQFAAHRTYCSI